MSADPNSQAETSDIVLSDGDYVLGDERAWFSIKGFAVWIRATGDGVAVEIYQNGNEDDDSMASAYAYDDDLPVTEINT